VLKRSKLSYEERSMRDCKRRKRSTDFIVHINMYSAKRFPGIISSVYEIGPMGKNGLADDEAITLQQAVNRCGCRRKVVAVQDMQTYGTM
jgi:hypothetical protein